MSVNAQTTLAIFKSKREQIRRKKSISEIVIEQTIRIEAVMVAQLVQRLLPTPRVHGSSPTSCYKHEHVNREVKDKFTKIGLQ